MIGLVDETKYTDITLPPTSAILDASAAVLNFTDRDFGSTTVTENRTYQYDGKGFLQIDDASIVNTVTMNGAVMASSRWRAGREGPAGAQAVYSYLELPRWSTESGEMGFQQNLDVFLAQNPQRLVDVIVNAAYGWAPVPRDVQRATIITAQAMNSATATGTGQQLSGKQVAEVSEQFLFPQLSEGNTMDPLPDAALKLLLPYKRIAL